VRSDRRIVTMTSVTAAAAVPEARLIDLEPDLPPAPA
jgi:hypothetical protein